jgi:carbon storage regulator
MLVLSRHLLEKINIGDDIEVIVVDIRGDKVRLGFEAPPDVPIHRNEVFEAIRSGGGSTERSTTLDHLEVLANKLKGHLLDQPKELQWLTKTIDLWLLDVATVRGWGAKGSAS